MRSVESRRTREVIPQCLGDRDDPTELRACDEAVESRPADPARVELHRVELEDDGDVRLREGEGAAHIISEGEVGRESAGQPQEPSEVDERLAAVILHGEHPHAELVRRMGPRRPARSRLGAHQRDVVPRVGESLRRRRDVHGVSGTRGVRGEGRDEDAHHDGM